MQHVGIVAHVPHHLFQTSEASVQAHEMKRYVRHPFQFDLQNIAEKVLGLFQVPLGALLIIGHNGESESLEIDWFLDDGVKGPSSS